MGTSYGRRGYRRDNFLYKVIFGVAYYWSNYPKILIEVFIRKNFGRRYFSFGLCLFLALCLAAYPKLWEMWYKDHGYIIWNKEHSFEYLFWMPYLSWYVYLSLFLIFSLIRFVEVLRQPKEFSMKYKSTYAGDISMFFWTLGRPETKKRIKQGKVSEKEMRDLKFNSQKFVEVVLEPLPFFVLGVILYLIKQKFGVVLITCSLFYSFGNYGAYMHVEEDIQDELDIMNHTKIVPEALDAIKRRDGIIAVSREEMDSHSKDENNPVKIT
jgi:hypothetical protein